MALQRNNRHQSGGTDTPPCSSTDRAVGPLPVAAMLRTTAIVLGAIVAVLLLFFCVCVVVCVCVCVCFGVASCAFSFNATEFSTLHTG